MATKASIEFNFRRAMNQADQIDNLANNLSNLSRNRFAGAMQGISANWKGDNASLYLSKGERLQGNMNGSANELHSIASDIRTVARRLYRAEMAALEIAMRREY